MRAAREVFSELGYDAATFQAIAVRADLTRPAINHYFSSKRVLYRAVLEQTNAMVVTGGFEKAMTEDTLMGQLSAFVSVITQVDAQDRAAAAFLVTAVLESARHPELRDEEHDPLAKLRGFVTWAITSAIERGELTTETDISSLTELLLAVLWGMGFYAGFVGSGDHLEKMTHQLESLMVGKLWSINEKPSGV